MSTLAPGLSSPCIKGISSPNPFCTGSTTPCKSASSRHRDMLVDDSNSSSSSNSLGSSAIRGASPMSSLVKDLNGSLHLDSSPCRPPPAFEPYRCGQSPFSTNPQQQLQQTTPLLFKTRKRPIDEMSSPGMPLHSKSPTATLWNRQQGKHHRSSMLAGSPCNQTQPLFRRDSLGTDDESSFDDDGSLTNLPRMRASALKNISEDHVLECTPLKASAGKIKRARSQSSAIPCFEPLQEDQEMASPCPSNTRAAQAAANISPFARSQPECHLLPCTSSPTDPIMRVEASTVSDLLAGRYNDLYDEQIVVDCRFPYEYEGGHIASAANAPTIEALEQMLLDKPASNKRTVVILHCEYSIQRAPSMASHLRRRDREVNMHRYPYLHYPEIYVLKGGYRNFFSQHKSLCEPQNYVEMNDQAFTVDCRERMLQFNRQFKRTKSMNDAALTRSSAGYASATVGAPGALFAANSQSPTNMLGRTASSLPARARRLGRTQSARPGIDLVNFTNNS